MILYLSIFLVYTSVAYGFRYDYPFHGEAEGWLKVHEIPTTFHEAFLRCSYEGAVLASPSTEALKKALISVYPKSSNCGMYTGIHSTLSPGDYTTIEGIPLARIPVAWAQDEPDNFENKEECLVMLRDGTLADVMCNETYPYACFKKKTDNLEITDCGTIDTAYSLYQKTGSCYKFHRHGMSWKRAQMVCLAEGGYLAIINSRNEGYILKKIFAQYPPKNISCTWKDVAHIGFWGTDWKTNGDWYTVHGQKLEDSEYNVWSPDQPDDVGADCGAMFRNGYLDNVYCNTTILPFICEKDPNSLAPYYNKSKPVQLPSLMLVFSDNLDTRQRVKPSSSKRTGEQYRV